MTKIKMLSSQNWRASACVITLASLLALSGCGGGSSGNDSSGDNGSNTTFDLTAVLTGISGLMQRDFATLHTRMETLNTSVTAYCGDLSSASREANRAQAQQDFASAMDTLQNTLMYGGWSDGGGAYGIGPVQDDFRMTQLYSWPLTSTCNVDLALANDESDLVNAVNQRGMDIVQYLLFVDESANHSCPDNFLIDPDRAAVLNAFDNLDAADKELRRCNFMRNLVSDARDSAATLDAGWAADQGNFAAEMAGSTTPFETLNHITDGMFYFEKLIKEDKIDKPLGGSVTNNPPTCGAGQLCPADLESPQARLSKENLIANMQAFQRLYYGGSDDPSAQLGFDDWLTDEGHSELATRFGDNIQAVIDGLQAISGSFVEVFENDIGPLTTLQLGPVKAVSDELRFEVMPELGLALPAGSVSDTD
ncbi:MAG: imelysin family protein [Pseudomonadota bacterium]